MKKLGYLLLVFTVVFTSCSEDKEVIDERNAFVGTWSETYDLDVMMDGQEFEQNGTADIAISKGSQANEILFTSEGQTVKANVSGSTFVIPVQTITVDFGGTIYELNYSASGQLLNSQLEYDIVMVEKTGQDLSVSGKAVASKVE